MQSGILSEKVASNHIILSMYPEDSNPYYLAGERLNQVAPTINDFSPKAQDEVCCGSTEQLLYEYRLLETYSQSCACFLYLNWVLVWIAITATFALTAGISAIFAFGDEYCQQLPINLIDMCEEIKTFNSHEIIRVVAFIAVIGMLLSFIFLAGLKAFYQKKSSLLSYLLFIHIALLLGTVALNNFVTFAIECYMIYAICKLRRFFKEMQVIKNQLNARGLIL